MPSTAQDCRAKVLDRDKRASGIYEVKIQHQRAVALLGGWSGWLPDSSGRMSGVRLAGSGWSRRGRGARYGLASSSTMRQGPGAVGRTAICVRG
jgi:hypothetical protein